MNESVWKKNYACIVWKLTSFRVVYPIRQWAYLALIFSSIAPHASDRTDDERHKCNNYLIYLCSIPREDLFLALYLFIFTTILSTTLFFSSFFRTLSNQTNMHRRFWCEFLYGQSCLYDWRPPTWPYVFLWRGRMQHSL